MKNICSKQMIQCFWIIFYIRESKKEWININYSLCTLNILEMSIYVSLNSVLICRVWTSVSVDAFKGYYIVIICLKPFDIPVCNKCSIYRIVHLVTYVSLWNQRTVVLNCCVYFIQGCLYTSSMLLYNHGVLSVRSVVWGVERREGNSTSLDSGLGQTDCQWHALPTQSQNHPQGPQVTQVRDQMISYLDLISHWL